jgi:predicted metal-dependent hydrolase
MKTDELTVNGVKYLVKIHFENRKNCRVSIRKKTVNIRIPSFLSKEEKADQLSMMKNWAGKKLLENSEKFKPEPQKEYKNEDILKIGDEEYSLKIKFKDKKSSSAALNSNTIQLVISDNLLKEEQNNHISTLISRCIGSKRLPNLHAKVKELNKKHFNQNINKILFKHNKSNWGSCSRAGNINISTRLLLAPDDVLEYVCIHELAHLLEHNHSKKFWTLVETAMPEYKEKERWLKENGSICKF